MQTANGVGYPHDNDETCSNTLCRKCPFGMRVSKHTNMMMREHTGRDDQWVKLNQNGGASITVQLVGQ